MRNLFTYLSENLPTNLSNKLYFNFVIMIFISIGIVSCEPDKADIIKVIESPIDIEDTLNNRMIMEIDNFKWVSNSTAKVFRANGGIEFDASKWIDSSDIVEIVKIYVKNDKKTGKFFLQNIDTNANFGLYEEYQFSSPKPFVKYTSESGFAIIKKQTDSNIVGTFEMVLINQKSEKKIIKNGKFNLKFVD